MTASAFVVVPAERSESRDPLRRLPQTALWVPAFAGTTIESQ